MVHRDDFYERLETKNAEIENHQKQAIKKYGKKLGPLYHQFIYGDSNDQKIRKLFYLTIAQIFESGNLEEKALAVEAMISVTEVRVTALERTVSSSNAVY